MNIIIRMFMRLEEINKIQLMATKGTEEWMKMEVAYEAVLKRYTKAGKVLKAVVDRDWHLWYDDEEREYRETKAREEERRRLEEERIRLEANERQRVMDRRHTKESRRYEKITAQQLKLQIPIALQFHSLEVNEVLKRSSVLREVFEAMTEKQRTIWPRDRTMEASWSYYLIQAWEWKTYGRLARDYLDRVQATVPLLRGRRRPHYYNGFKGLHGSGPITRFKAVHESSGEYKTAQELWGLLTKSPLH